MRRTSRILTTSTRMLAYQCFVLLAVLANASGTRAEEWITHPSTSQGDAPQPELLDIPFTARPMGAAPSTKNSPSERDTWITDTLPLPSELLDVDSSNGGERDTWITDKLPLPSELLVVDSSNGDGEREVMPSYWPSGYGAVAVRAGWWAVAHQGSVTKVGEYQGLKSSPFWDLDLLKSDGVRTLDLFGTGLDNESTQAGLYYFTPDFTTNLRYQRFLHRLDMIP